jgi:hypothetical protein
LPVPTVYSDEWRGVELSGGIERRLEHERGFAAFCRSRANPSTLLLVGICNHASPASCRPQ